MAIDSAGPFTWAYARGLMTRAKRSEKSRSLDIGTFGEGHLVSWKWRVRRVERNCSIVTCRHNGAGWWIGMPPDRASIHRAAHRNVRWVGVPSVAVLNGNPFDRLHGTNCGDWCRWTAILRNHRNCHWDWVLHRVHEVSEDNVKLEMWLDVIRWSGSVAVWPRGAMIQLLAKRKISTNSKVSLRFDNGCACCK